VQYKQLSESENEDSMFTAGTLSTSRLDSGRSTFACTVSGCVCRCAWWRVARVEGGKRYLCHETPESRDFTRPNSTSLALFPLYTRTAALDSAEH
jgi:hypothetical protein